jgi:prepilin-type N-terminal cleavage/methylation domain-containing protein
MKPKIKRLKKHKYLGFTLIELLLVLALSGLLMAVTIPGLVGSIRIQTLNTANTEAYQILRQAQSTSKQRKEAWQASFRKNGDNIEWAVHPSRTSVTSSSINWTTLGKNIFVGTKEGTKKIAGIDTVVKETSLKKHTSLDIWWISFNQSGHVSSPGRITFKSKVLPDDLRRCVSVETLIGAMGISKDDDCFMP